MLSPVKSATFITSILFSGDTRVPVGPLISKPCYQQHLPSSGEQELSSSCPGILGTGTSRWIAMESPLGLCWPWVLRTRPHYDYPSHAQARACGTDSMVQQLPHRKSPGCLWAQSSWREDRNNLGGQGEPRSSVVSQMCTPFPSGQYVHLYHNKTGVGTRMPGLEGDESICDSVCGFRGCQHQRGESPWPGSSTPFKEYQLLRVLVLSAQCLPRGLGSEPTCKAKLGRRPQGACSSRVQYSCP